MTQELVIKQKPAMPLKLVRKLTVLLAINLLLAVGNAVNAQTVIKQCWETSSCDPALSWATSKVTINSAANELTIRVTYGKTLNNTTYGTNKSSNAHPNKGDLKALLNSDMVELKVYNSSNQVKLFFRLDALDRTGSGVPYNYFAAGFGGDAGALYTGASSDFIRFKTSIAENLQTYYATNPTYFENTSPTTDAFYSINPQYPLWDFNLWYEVTVKLSAVGTYGSIDITDMHNSPPAVGTCQSVDPFPVTCHNKVGNLVWNDLNKNGIKDATEPGISGITMRLYEDYNNDNIPDGSYIASTTTNSTGNYSFTGLQPGNYIVSIVKSSLPSGMIITNNGVDPDNDIDNDNNGLQGIASATEIFTRSVTLTPYEEPITGIDGDGTDGNLTVDFGLYATLGSIGDRVWYDTDRDGIQDAGENGIRGVTVKLRNASNTVVATTTTDVNGNYLFSGLAAGTYTVEFPVTVYGYILSPAYVGSNRDVDSDPSGSTGITPSIALATGQNITNIDAGFAPDCNCTNSPNNLLTNASFENGTTGWSWSAANGSLTTGTGYVACGSKNGFNNWGSGTSRVWQDVNMAAGSTVTFTAFAGTHTPGLNCSPKLSLIFLNAANAVIGQTDVTVNRNVDIYNGQLAQYMITAIAPANTAKVRVQSSITCNTMKLDAFCLTASAPILGSIGDRVWADTNKDGVQNTGEVGLAGVVVTLYDGTTNNVVASTVTDAYGNYLFSNLPTGAAGTDYQVRFSLVPGYRFSPSTGVVSSATNSDAHVNTGRTGTITLTNAVPNVNYVDAGMYYTETARIGDFVWNDLNKNGIQEAGEPGIAGVTVMLYTAGDVLYRTTVTNSNGQYYFNEVPAGSYYVKVAPPLGYQVSPKNVGATNLDSDIDPVTRKTANITVVAGTSNLTIDAGLNVTPTTGASASLGDRVWEDLNNNNIQDPGEPGVPNVTVELFNSSNTSLGTVTTDAFGYYIFNGLVPADYYVKFSLPAGFSYVTANVGTNDDIDSDANGTGTSQVVTLAADEINTSVDAGIRRNTPGAILGDYVWYDLNKNGLQDGGNEVGVPGITALLYNSSNVVVATTTTDINGFYLFAGLLAGSYTVGFENIPAGYGFSPNTGTVETTNNSDVNPSTGRTGTITVAAGSSNRFVDAGLIITPNTFSSKASVGDKLWNDLNNNGIQDPGEPGIPGVTVTLYGADGTTVIATTTTDALGNYLFTNLDAGTYVVGFSGLPTGYVFATKDAGTDDTKDSDADGITGKTAPFTLAPGEINLSIDAGARSTNATLSSLGNFVWYDVNGNGIQNTGEPGAAGVSVALKDATGNTIKTTTTSATGEYRFTDLAAGTYSIQFGNLPAGYAATTKNAAGSTTANNSDADQTTLATDAIVLPVSTNDLTWDMGIVSTTRASIGDFVWNDLNQDGIQNAGEPGVSGVTITLYDNNNNPVATTITDANGAYLFSNVIPGTYSVGFSNIPASSSFTTQNAAGGTPANNSDADPATGRTASFTVVGGQSKTDVDAGLVSLKAAVGDYVWHDLNRNGIQDATEVGVPGVTVTMYRSTDAIIGNGDDVAVASAVTGSNGYYFINDVTVAIGGSPYYMRYTDVPGAYFTFTTPLVGGTGAANNSKVTSMAISNGRTGFFMLNPGQVYRDMDAGVYKPLSLSGNVWHDVNGMTDNLVNNSGAAQVPPAIVIPTGMRISLVDAVTGLVVNVALVQGNGMYNFPNVNPGNYILVLSTVPGTTGQLAPFATVPQGWVNTGENLGLQPGRDAVINGKLSVSVTTSNVTNVNFGIQLNNDDIGIN